jgi:hypothetical protein
MEDNTPLNLEDQPKLFGLRYDQLIAVMASLILSTQFYAWCEPIPIPLFGQDLRLDIAMFLFMLGPFYCLATLHGSITNWEQLFDFYLTSQVLIPGPDPNPVRFLTDEKFPEPTE